MKRIVALLVVFVALIAPFVALTAPAVAQDCRYFATPETLASGAFGRLQCDATGNLRVTGTVATSGTTAATQSGTWTVQPGNTANTTPWLITPTPSAAAGAGVTSASSTAAGSSLVVKASAGNLYQLTVTIGATTGYVLLFDATSLPIDGAVTPVYCQPVISNATLGSVALEFNPPKVFATGITAGFSTTGCFTLTASTTAAFFAGFR